MKKNTVERTIEMNYEKDFTSGEEKTIAEITSSCAPYDLLDVNHERNVTDIAAEETQYAIARLKAILADRYLKKNEEISVSLTVSVRTIK